MFEVHQFLIGVQSNQAEIVDVAVVCFECVGDEGLMLQWSSMLLDDKRDDDRPCWIRRWDFGGGVRAAKYIFQIQKNPVSGASPP